MSQEKTKHFDVNGNVVYCKPYRSLGSYMPSDVKALGVGMLMLGAIGAVAGTSAAMFTGLGAMAVVVFVASLGRG